MKHIASLLLSTGLLAACTSTAPSTPETSSYGSAIEALNVYYRSIPASELPAGPELKELDLSKPLTRIMVASCNDEEKPDPALASIAREDADLFLFIGDNVYGDMDGRSYVSFDVELAELREAYNDLADMPEYNAVADAMPILATWDDHDFGLNDDGEGFPAHVLSERIFEKFFHMDDTEIAERPGIYYSRMVGPPGQRTQIIMLDTRYFRSDLMPTDEYGKTGKERYIPSTADAQQMLGDAQWASLEEELKKPADLCLLVSSIQIIPDDHGWESWDKLPAERDRLYALLEETKAEGVVFLSGDRHTAFLYKDEDRGPYPYYELTASSLNQAFARDPVSTEYDGRQIGDGYTPGNYGEVEIDWEGETIQLTIKSETGEDVSVVGFTFAEINAG